MKIRKPDLVNIYNSSGSLLNSSAANQGDANRIHWWPSMDHSNVIAVDSANNFFFIQADEANRDQNYLVKYDSSGNFVNEKKLPPNLMVNGISIRQNSAGEEFIYVAGFDRYGAANHSHSYGVYSNLYQPSYIGKLANSVAPVSSTPGYASIKFEINTIPTSNVYICPKYGGSDITTATISDELAVHPAGPTNQTYPHNSNPYYNNAV